MRIVLLTAGAGGMYCGSCLHANTLVAALRQAGEDALLLPLYTPLRTDEENVSLPPVAYGAVSVYLQQRWAVFRRTPWLLDRLTGWPTLLRWVGRRGATVRPENLGELTVSMLRGEEGRQHKELEKLVRWLQKEAQPDVIHLGNILLCGVARELTRRLGVPVVCTLSGEDVFLEKLPEPHCGQARMVLCERSADLAGLAAMNRYYAEVMADYLAVPRERLEVIRPGLNLSGHAPPAPQSPPSAADTLVPKTVTIGYLARVCPEKGLHLLAEAFRLLCEDGDLPAVQLRAAGYLHPADRPYLGEIRRRLAEWGLAERFHYVGELDRPAKIAFLQSLDVLSVPTVYRESKGLSVLEAWANGVPAVLPAHGTFPELIADTGGGLLCEPNDPAALAEGLKRMIRQPAFAAECGRRAQQIVHQRYSAEMMAQRTIQWYRRVCGKQECL